MAIVRYTVYAVIVSLSLAWLIGPGVEMTSTYSSVPTTEPGYAINQVDANCANYDNRAPVEDEYVRADGNCVHVDTIVSELAAARVITKWGKWRNVSKSMIGERVENVITGGTFKVRRNCMYRTSANAASVIVCPGGSNARVSFS